MLRFLLRKAGKAMINMSTVNSIRQQRRDGFSISDIARMNGASQDTVYKYISQDDFSPEPPAKRRSPSKLPSWRGALRKAAKRMQECTRRKQPFYLPLLLLPKDQLAAGSSR